MQDKPVALVTGANQGIGLQMAKDLVAHGFCFCIDLARRTGAQERLAPTCNLRFPKERPMIAPKITVAMIAAP
jgi:NAD(P)-dependent dehydrogenase (short-subunit alcohol dehydrogenase family)